MDPLFAFAFAAFRFLRDSFVVESSFRLILVFFKPRINPIFAPVFISQKHKIA